MPSNNGTSIQGVCGCLRVLATLGPSTGGQLLLGTQQKILDFLVWCDGTVAHGKLRGRGSTVDLGCIKFKLASVYTTYVRLCRWFIYIYIHNYTYYTVNLHGLNSVFYLYVWHIFLTYFNQELYEIVSGLIVPVHRFNLWSPRGPVNLWPKRPVWCRSSWGFPWRRSRQSLAHGPGGNIFVVEAKRTSLCPKCSDILMSQKTPGASLRTESQSQWHDKLYILYRLDMIRLYNEESVETPTIMGSIR